MSDSRKIVFKLSQDADGYPPVSYESVWANPLGNGQFEIDNIPFFTCDATFGDVVSVDEEMGELTFVTVIKNSGNSLLRLIYVDGADVGGIRAALKGLGCSTEWDDNHRLISVNVAATVPLSRVRDFLNLGLERGISDYEEAIVRE